MNANIALVDDHSLLRKGLASLIQSFDMYSVIIEANNGKDFIQKLRSDLLPDVVLMDINMPEMDGYEASNWLKEHHPSIKILALSMYDHETAIIRMFRAGAKGYILKDCDPAELRSALHSVIHKGFYYSEMITGSLIHNINSRPGSQVANGTSQLNEREITFLKLVCSELTYKEIADKMFLSPRTIDGYRDALFEKLNAKTRVGLVLYAIKYGIVKV